MPQLQNRGLPPHILEQMAGERFPDLFACSKILFREPRGVLGIERRIARNNVMSMKNKLQHPFALIAQGFIAGAILFYPAVPAEAGTQQTAPTRSDLVVPS